MKERKWYLALFLLCILPVLFYFSDKPSGGTTGSVQVGKMAEYMNEKYGYSLTVSDCVYFREEDYSYRPAFIGGTQFDVPHIAIFKHNDSYITVTDRKGFLGDNGQLDELIGLLCGYFEKETGLKPEYVEIGTSEGDRNAVLNTILFRHYNEKLSADNMDEFMEYVFEQSGNVELIFYFKAEEDTQQQLDTITKGLGTLKKHANINSLRFYVTDQEQLNIHSSVPKAHLLTVSENNRESDDGYVMRHAHVVNDVEYHYPISEAAAIQDPQFNSFFYGGYCKMNSGQSGKFGSRKVTDLNGFGVVDLSDAALEGYLKSMHSYGAYRGYTILLDEGEKDTTTEVTLGLENEKYYWRFIWLTGPFELYAFKNGQLLDLKTAYDCGYLSPDDINEIYQKHKEYFRQRFNTDYDSALK